MNRKHNPMVALVGLLLLALLLATTAGCAAPAAAAEEQATNVWRFTDENCGNGCRIITDKQTGVQYLFYVCGYGGGLTVLQDGEG